MAWVGGHGICGERNIDGGFVSDASSTHFPAGQGLGIGVSTLPHTVCHGRAVTLASSEWQDDTNTDLHKALSFPSTVI